MSSKKGLGFKQIGRHMDRSLWMTGYECAISWPVSQLDCHYVY